MKKETFCDVFGDIKDDYIASARAPNTTTPLSRVKGAAIAAVLCFIVGGLLAFPRLSDAPNEPIPIHPPSPSPSQMPDRTGPSPIPPPDADISVPNEPSPSPETDINIFFSQIQDTAKAASKVEYDHYFPGFDEETNLWVISFYRNDDPMILVQVIRIDTEGNIVDIQCFE